MSKGTHGVDKDLLTRLGNLHIGDADRLEKEFWAWIEAASEGTKLRLLADMHIFTKSLLGEGFRVKGGEDADRREIDLVFDIYQFSTLALWRSYQLEELRGNAS